MARKKQTATQKLRANVQRTIRNAEKRGYSFSEEFKSSIKSAKYQTLKSVQKGRYRKLYEQGTVDINGEKVSGTYYRNVVEPRKAAAKAAATRAKKKRIREREPASWSDDYDESIDEGAVIFQHIENEIRRFPTEGAKGLNEQLQHMIKQYGFTKVMQGLANAPVEIVEYAQTLIEYGSTKAVHSRAYRMFTNLLEGAIPDREQRIEIGEVVESMS